MSITSVTLSANADEVASRIESVTRITSTPVQYGRVDYTVILTSAWEDPYASKDITLDFRIVAPDGQKLTLPAYYERGPSEHSSVWRARFAPAQTGTYSGRFVLNDKNGTTESAPVSFEVTSSENKGFLHTDGLWALRFENGELFRGIGENMCWEAVSDDSSGHFKELNQNSRFHFEYMFGSLARSGGNFTRIWMCQWGIPLEWKKVAENSPIYRDSDAHFNPSSFEVMDRVVNILEDTDVYLMLAIGAHVDLRDNWADSNYNAANGGPCEKPADFFTNPTAREMYKDRLRYIVARWGYSTNIAAWEFWNEIDLIVEADSLNPYLPKNITAWHGEMSDYLAQIDPYDHIVTTSVAYFDVEGMNDLPNIDLNQRHIYRNTRYIPQCIREHVTAHGKPYVIGEYGYDWDWKNDFNKFADKMDYDFKQGQWTGMFSPTPILPLSWWWEFFDERGVVKYLSRVRAMNELMMERAQGQFAESPVKWTGSEVIPLGVQAGESLFVLIVNADKNAAANGSVELKTDASKSYTVRAYSTERDLWADMPPLKAGETRIAGLSVPAWDNLILLLTPTK